MTRASRIQAFYSELSPRARGGLLVLAVLLGSWILMILNDAVAEKRAGVTQARANLQARQIALSQEDWDTRAQEAAQIRAQAEAEFWRAPTQGIAAARIQGALEAAARAAGVTEPRIDVRLVSDDRGGALFEAQVSGADPGGRFATYIEAVAAADGDLRLSYLEFRSAQRGFTARFIAPAIIDAEAGPDA